jgi:hypothetical protein
MKRTRISGGGGRWASSAMSGSATCHSISLGFTPNSFCKIPFSQTGVVALYLCTVTFLPASSAGSRKGDSIRQYMQRKRNRRERKTGNALSGTPLSRAKINEEIESSPPSSFPATIMRWRAPTLSRPSPKRDSRCSSTPGGRTDPSNRAWVYGVGPKPIVRDAGLIV